MVTSLPFFADMPVVPVVYRRLCQRQGLDRLPKSRHAFVRTSGALLAVLSLAVCAPALLTTAYAQRIENQVAVFAALDKVTARISRLEIKLGDSVRFGALKIKPRTCYSRAADQQPKTSTFVEVQEVQLDSSEKKIFSGWMFAENPGLNAVEHPVYDVWLTECLSPKVVAGRTPSTSAARANPQPNAPAATAEPGAGLAPGPGAGEDDFRRRRPPR